MERLTNKAWRNLDPWECCGQDNYCKRGCFDEGGCNKGCIVPKIYDKLARYEDAEEQGRLIVLPCKVGDTVWFVLHEHRLDVPKGVHNGVITRIKAIQRLKQETIFLADIQFSYVDPWFHDGRTSDTEIQASFTEYGSWVRFYLTREEAVKALEGKT